MKISLPYGHNELELDLPGNDYTIDCLLPVPISRTLALSAEKLVEQALSSPIGDRTQFRTVTRNNSIAITINDKTRPVPNNLLLKPLLERFSLLGVPDENITLFIASGTHDPMPKSEFSRILSQEFIDRFRIVAHDCDDNTQLYELGLTKRGTPVLANRLFIEKDIKIVVGDIELHHFAGYSGGVKSAAIGLNGRKTINANHKLLIDPLSRMGEYDQNPLRQDIEEIGALMGIDYALNAVLDENKTVLAAFFGDPIAVMQEGIRKVDQISRIPCENKYDLVIASAGGYPKDINLYQAQKAMTHASYFCKKGGSIILLAECSEGAGSEGFLNFLSDVRSPEQAIQKFEREGFSVGPHKAFQIARILESHAVYLLSSMPARLVKYQMLVPMELSEINRFIPAIVPQNGRIAILPYATACIPYASGE